MKSVQRRCVPTSFDRSRLFVRGNRWKRLQRICFDPICERHPANAVIHVGKSRTPKDVSARVSTSMSSNVRARRLSGRLSRGVRVAHGDVGCLDSGMSRVRCDVVRPHERRGDRQFMPAGRRESFRHAQRGIGEVEQSAARSPWHRPAAGILHQPHDRLGVLVSVGPHHLGNARV